MARPVAQRWAGRNYRVQAAEASGSIMSNYTHAIWQKLARSTELLIWLVGLLLTAYIIAVVFGWASHGPVFYVDFALGIVVMSGLLALGDTASSIAYDGPSWARGLKYFCSAVGMLSGIVGLTYFRVNVHSLVLNAPFFGPTAIHMGYLIIASIVILTWVHWGWLLSCLSAGAVLYFYFGNLIPIALLQHPAYDPGFVMNYTALNTNQGIFEFVSVAADDLYLLIIFGVTLLGVGMLQMVIELGKWAGRRFRGGAAFPAILGSGAVGSVMGQAVSNVVLSGRLTIPMMKEHGFSGSMAGAIEATASTSGQIMPPILGLGGFLIASFLGLPYVTVALAAFIPALLYIFGTVVAVIVYSLREDLPRLEETVDKALIFRLFPTFIAAFVVVIWLLLGYRAPGYAGLVGIAVALGISLLQGRYRPRLGALKEALREGLMLTAILSLLIMAIGPLGQVMVTTNLSGRLASLLATILPHNELLLLIGSMVLSLFLGMGLPTPIAYVVAELAMVPFLEQIGVGALRANFFVFYFAVFSTLSPPVAISVLAASKLAHASFRSTAVNALKIAATTFIIPFAFVFNKALLAFPHLEWSLWLPLLEVLITQGVVAIAAYGYCFKRLSGVERVGFACLAFFGYWTLTHGQPWLWDSLLFGGLSLLLIWCVLSGWNRVTAFKTLSAERVQ